MLNLDVNHNQQQNIRALGLHSHPCRNYLKLMHVPDYKTAKILFCTNDKHLKDMWSLLVFSKIGVLSIGVISAEGNTLSTPTISNSKTVPIYFFSTHNYFWNKNSINAITVKHNGFVNYVFLKYNQNTFTFKIALNNNILDNPKTLYWINNINRIK